MADELNTPTHRYHQKQYNILLAPNEVSKQMIYASGIQKIDAKIIGPLFALAEPGVWYDPSDLTTLFQDSAGTTPVTGPNQPVGKMLDKSGRGNHATQATSTQRPIYGINPITGTRNLLTYSQDLTNGNWTKPAGVTAATARVTFASGGGAESLRQFFNFTAGQAYALSFDARSISGNTALSIDLNNVDTQNFTLTGTTQRFTWTVTPAASRAWLDFQLGGAGTIELTNIQLEQSTTATAYQKVVSQYEVTEAGVQSASYLAFDGVDDGMVTGTITPATDKVQVFAGVRKFSSLTAILAEFSASVNTNAGSFYVVSGLNPVDGFSFNSRGSLDAVNLNFSVAAPITSVIASLSDIAAPVAALRINSSQVATSTTTQGTGNYLAYPLYIGRRGGTTLPFNGRIYSLIVRFGANLTNAQITSTESWVNSKTGAY